MAKSKPVKRRKSRETYEFSQVVIGQLSTLKERWGAASKSETARRAIEFAFTVQASMSSSEGQQLILRSKAGEETLLLGVQLPAVSTEVAEGGDEK